MKSFFEIRLYQRNKNSVKPYPSLLFAPAGGDVHMDLDPSLITQFIGFKEESVT